MEESEEQGPRRPPKTTTTTTTTSTTTTTTNHRPQTVFAQVSDYAPPESARSQPNDNNDDDVWKDDYENDTKDDDDDKPPPIAIVDPSRFTQSPDERPRTGWMVALVTGLVVMGGLFFGISARVRPNGWLCSDDSQCSSGHCCPIDWKLDRCSECCIHQHCVDQMEQPPAPGTYGTPFCRKEDRTCSAFKNGHSSQISLSSGYPVWVPINDETDLAQVDMPRTVVEGTDPVMEQVWYFDLTEQPVENVASRVDSNGTHVWVPLHTQFLAGYSRTYHMYEEHETGIITSVFLPNSVSVVMDQPKAGMAEKVHALTYTSEYSTARGQAVRARNQAILQQSNQDDDDDNKFDLATFATRWDALAVIWGTLGIINAQLEAGIDKAHLWQIRRYVNDTTVQIPQTPTQTEEWRHHRQLAKEALALAHNKSFLETRTIHKSENHCRHFEQPDPTAAAGSGVDYNDTHIIFPLDTPLTMLSGEMTFSPMYYLGLNGGYTTVQFQKETQVLELYYRAHQQSRSYTDPQLSTDNTKPSGLWLSRLAAPAEYDVDATVEGRSDQYLSLDKPQFALRKLVRFVGDVLDIQKDTTLWARPQTETCNLKFIQQDGWERAWEEIRLGGNGDSDYERLLLQVKTIALSNRGIACGASFMRSDYGNDTHAYGLNEFGVWNHMLLEVTQGHTRVIATAPWWDDWECFYTNQDVAQCRP